MPSSEDPFHFSPLPPARRPEHLQPGAVQGDQQRLPLDVDAELAVLRRLVVLPVLFLEGKGVGSEFLLIVADALAEQDFVGGEAAIVEAAEGVQQNVIKIPIAFTPGASHPPKP